MAKTKRSNYGPLEEKNPSKLSRAHSGNGANVSGLTVSVSFHL